VKPRLEFAQVVVEVTEACHHHCVHCYNFWRKRRTPVNSPQTLTRKEILTLIRKVRRDAPIRQVALSGGEPLLRNDLPEIVSDLASEGLSVVVITNGTLLTDDCMERFPEGTTFEITLFSVDAEIHDRIAGRVGAFKKVLRASEYVTRHNCRLALSCVINRFNAHDVLQTIELGIALGAEAVLLNRINLSRHSLPMADLLVPTVEQLTNALDAADEAARLYGIAVAVSVPIPPCLVDISRYEHLHFGWCPRGSKDAYYTISYNGLVRPCNHSSVILGDLRTESFRAIVTREGAQDFWMPVPLECQQCDRQLQDVCRGGCPAASDECYGTRNRMDPFVEIVRQQAAR
jgi:PqqA peptide cyclase